MNVDEERQRTEKGGRFHRHRRKPDWLLWMGLAGVLISARLAAAQAGQSGSESRLGIAEIPTPLSQLPDANVQMALQAKRKAVFRFDAANTLRQRQIEDEAARVLLLARHLKEEMERLGDGPLPEGLIREAAMIELLARDVQARMVLTVGGG